MFLSIMPLRIYMLPHRISRVSQFFLYGIKLPLFRPHPMLQICENKKSVPCPCPKLLNFEFGETANIEILYNEKTGFKEKELLIHYL